MKLEVEGMGRPEIIWPVVSAAGETISTELPLTLMKLLLYKSEIAELLARRLLFWN